MSDLSNRKFIKIHKVWYEVTHYKNHPGTFFYFKKYNLCDVTEEFDKINGHSDGYVEDILDQYKVDNIPLIVMLNSIQKETPKNIYF